MLQFNDYYRLLFSANEQLKKSNFDVWYLNATSILEAKGILMYTQSDVIAIVKAGIQAGSNTSEDLQNAMMVDSKARAFLLTSISMEIKVKVKNLKTAYAMMTKIKEFYDHEKTKGIDHYVRKIKLLEGKEHK